LIEDGAVLEYVDVDTVRALYRESSQDNSLNFWSYGFNFQDCSGRAEKE